MAQKPTTTENNAQTAVAQSFKPTTEQLALIGAITFNGANKLVAVTNGIVKLQLWHYNTKANDKIVVGLNKNGNVSAYGVTHLTVYLQNKQYSVRYEYLGKDYEVMPAWLTALLKDYKQVSATAHTIKTLEDQIAALQAKAAKLAGGK